MGCSNQDFIERCVSLNTCCLNPLRRERNNHTTHPNFHNNTINRLSLVEELVEGSGERRGLAVISLNGAEFLLYECGSIGVLAEHDLLVAKRVLLLDSTTLGLGLALGAAEDALDFGRVDETGKVGLSNNGGGEEKALLALVDRVELLDGGRSPDNEAAEVTTGGELEEVEGVDGAGLDTGEVPEALGELLAVGLGGVDDKGSTALAVAAASKLALSSAKLLGSLGLLDIGTGTDSLEELKSGLGLGDARDSGGVDNEGNLGDSRDLVATGHQERSDGRGGKSRGSSETPVNPC